MDTDDGIPFVIYEDNIPARKEAYLRYLRRDGNKPQAAQRVAASRSVLTRWRKEDADFKAAEEDALYEASARYIRRIIAAAARGDLKAAIFLTERLNPEDFGKVTEALPEFVPPPRLTRPSLTEIPTIDVDGQYREVKEDEEEDRAPASTQAPDPGSPRQPQPPPPGDDNPTPHHRDTDVSDDHLGPERARHHPLELTEGDHANGNPGSLRPDHGGVS